jgi:hypothetical protein
MGDQAPALGGGVPIEEYVFYFTGFVAVGISARVPIG